jgi:arylsulfatase A-like enzyme
MFYYRGPDLYAVRLGPWKAHLITQPAYGPGERIEHDPPVLYNLETDPSETTDVAKDHPEVVVEIAKLVAEHRKTVEPVPSQLEIPLADRE